MEVLYIFGEKKRRQMSVKDTCRIKVGEGIDWDATVMCDQQRLDGKERGLCMYIWVCACECVLAVAIECHLRTSDAIVPGEEFFECDGVREGVREREWCSARNGMRDGKQMDGQY